MTSITGQGGATRTDLASKRTYRVCAEARQDVEPALYGGKGDEQ